MIYLLMLIAIFPNGNQQQHIQAFKTKVMCERTLSKYNLMYKGRAELKVSQCKALGVEGQ